MLFCVIFVWVEIMCEGDRHDALAVNWHRRLHHHHFAVCVSHWLGTWAHERRRPVRTSCSATVQTTGVEQDSESLRLHPKRQPERKSKETERWRDTSIEPPHADSTNSYRYAYCCRSFDGWLVLAGWLVVHAFLSMSVSVCTPVDLLKSCRHSMNICGVDRSVGDRKWKVVYYNEKIRFWIM